MGEYERDLALFQDEYVPNAEAAQYHRKWLQANANGDGSRWVAYRDALFAGQAPNPPNMATAYGRALVAAGEQHVSISHLVGAIQNPNPGPDPTPPPGQPPPPPSGNELTWAPPTLDPNNTVNYTLTNANRGSIPAGAGRDLRITQSEIITGPLNELRGWRHIVWIGGQINSTVGGVAGHIIPRENTGIAHFEGIYHNPTATGSDFMGLRSDTSGVVSPEVRLQNCNLTVFGSSPHADVVQTQFCRLSALKVDKCTIRTDYQAFFIQNEPGNTQPAAMGTIDLKRVNFKPIVAGTPPSGSWMYKGLSGTDAFRNNLGVWTLNEVYVDPGVPNPGMNVVPATNFFSYISNTSHRFGCFVRSDAISQYVEWSKTSDIVPTGTFAGQSAFDCGINGKLRILNPPGGDFCPVGVPGLNYISPGYLP